MKKIVIMRHAKSSWDDDSLKDFDRPLNDRGMHDASLLGGFIKRSGQLPDLIFSSPAKRARQTATLFCESTSVKTESVIWTDKFYYGSASDYVDAIRSCDFKDVETVMLVGHNPLVEQTVRLLCGENQHSLLRMPTAAVVCLEYPADDWKSTDNIRSRFKWMVTPGILKKI